MSLKIIAVGKIKRAELRALCDEYLKRLSRYGGAEIIEIKDSDAETEAGNMLGKLANFKGRIYALTEEVRRCQPFRPYLPISQGRLY